MKKIILFLFCICLFGISSYGQQEIVSEDSNFISFELDSLVAELEPTGKSWLPFMKGKNVLTGLYILKAGENDQQRPHDTDEVYYVVSGKGKFKAGDKIVNIEKGSILFVKADVEHLFFDITEDTVLVVFFDQ